MDVIEDVLDRLAACEECGYHADAGPAMEPTALAALALIAHGRADRARAHLDWLAAVQGADGSVGVEKGQANPGWPTGWAIMAWHEAAKTISPAKRYTAPLARGISWLLGIQGTQIEFLDKSGHDTTIIGWPWVEGTHSWVEPTAISVLALRHTGMADHPRAREGLRLLVDRLLRSGGCNYGNTVIFGQELRPHLQPTGLTLLALAGQHDPAGRIDRAIKYLRSELSSETPTASLSYGLLGLAAQKALPDDAREWIAAAAARTLARDASCYKLALAALAVLGPASPLIPAPARNEGALTT